LKYLYSVPSKPKFQIPLVQQPQPQSQPQPQTKLQDQLQTQQQENDSNKPVESFHNTISKQHSVESASFTLDSLSFAASELGSPLITPKPELKPQAALTSNTSHEEIVAANLLELATDLTRSSFSTLQPQTFKSEYLLFRIFIAFMMQVKQ
jgi:hypothetical protein